MSKICTGKVRFSYANVWEPQSINGSEPKYSVSLIIRKDDKKTIDAINEAIKSAYETGKSKLQGNGKSVPSLAALKTPLRDGDVDRPDDENYANSFFINANSKLAPGIVDKNRQQILDKNEFYSGCYGRATLTFYAFNSNGNKGIACGLNNLQKLADGDNLGGFTSAEDDFANDFEDEDFLG